MTNGLVVVLGRTGRNFAAGMTGGIAYVLDENRDFASRCNRAGVDLERLSDAADIGLVRSLIERHMEATSSPRAGWVLDNWESMIPKFVKVFPHEYKRVLGIPRSETAQAQPLPSRDRERAVPLPSRDREGAVLGGPQHG
jgi:glutamate synthase domain-containing protein 3